MSSSPILLLGPSGIGKTTVIKQMSAHIPAVTFIVLDNIVHKLAREEGLIDKKQDLNALINVLEHDRERFFTYGLMALEHYLEKVDASCVVVDVGTGFLDASASLAWVADKQSICLLSEPAIAFDRFRKARALDISYEQYCTTQFSKKRLQIYNHAAVVLKSDKLTEHELAKRCLLTICAMLPADVAANALTESLSYVIK